MQSVQLFVFVLVDFSFSLAWNLNFCLLEKFNIFSKILSFSKYFIQIQL